MRLYQFQPPLMAYYQLSLIHTHKHKHTDHVTAVYHMARSVNSLGV